MAPSQDSPPLRAISTREESLRRLRSRGLVRDGAVTYLFSVLGLVANLVSGIVSARALGPNGRGITVGLSAITQLLGFFFAMGAAQSLSYFIAQRSEDGPRLFTSWLLILLPLSVLAVVIGELLLGALFSAHNNEAISAGRWFLVTVILVIALELNSGLLLGAHDFVYFNALRFAQPAMMAVSFVVLWRLGKLTVTSALIAPTVATGIVLAVGIRRSVKRVGVGAPDLRLGLKTLWYGIRGHGLLIAANVNARLDVAILPAYVGASSVGIYSVATNVSLIIYQLSNTFSALLLAAVARDPKRARQKVLGSLFATVGIAGALAVVLGLFARPVLSLVYGARFGDAATTLRLLLPGAVLFAGSSILSAGVYASGRPLTTSLAQLTGMAVTVVGLAIFLHLGGITAAAIVSTAAYTTVFVTSLVAYKLVGEVPWRSFLPTPSHVRALVS
jgi:O-antigen/teichoic acid export membrane protein